MLKKVLLPIVVIVLLQSGCGEIPDQISEDRESVQSQGTTITVDRATTVVIGCEAGNRIPTDRYCKWKVGNGNVYITAIGSNLDVYVEAGACSRRETFKPNSYHSANSYNLSAGCMAILYLENNTLTAGVYQSTIQISYRRASCKIGEASGFIA